MEQEDTGHGREHTGSRRASAVDTRIASETLILGRQDRDRILAHGIRERTFEHGCMEVK